jgi:hypothetical protein
MPADGVAGLMTLFDPHRVADPYPTYAWLRTARPIWRPVERVYVLSRLVSRAFTPLPPGLL